MGPTTQIHREPWNRNKMGVVLTSVIFLSSFHQSVPVEIGQGQQESRLRAVSSGEDFAEEVTANVPVRSLSL